MKGNQMSDAEILNARIDKLEMHVAHQDQTIEDLQKVVSDLWTEIERLTRKLAALGVRLEAVEERTDTAAPVEPPPPHY
jgi:SlyX protein